jgi:hypothetical protein
VLRLPAFAERVVEGCEKSFAYCHEVDTIAVGTRP